MSANQDQSTPNNGWGEKRKWQTFSQNASSVVNFLTQWKSYESIKTRITAYQFKDDDSRSRRIKNNHFDTGGTIDKSMADWLNDCLIVSLLDIRCIGYYIKDNITCLFDVARTCTLTVCQVIAPNAVMRHYMVHELSFYQ